MAQPKLNERIVILRSGTAPDGQGGLEDGWSAVATVWAQIRPLSGREQMAAAKEQTLTIYQIIVRRPVDYTLFGDDRVLWKSNGEKLMAVREILDFGGRDPWMTFMAESGGL